MKISININGNDKSFEIESNEYLLDLLKKNGYLGVRDACETQSCGVCTVLMDDKPIHSCALLAVKANNRKILTIEGVEEEASKIADALVNEGVDQCGYCSPSFTLTLLGMERELHNPSDEEIKEYFMGNLCRCSGYVGQIRGIRQYLEGKNENSK